MNDPYKWLTDFFANRKVGSPKKLEFMIPSLFERYFLIQDNYGIIDGYPFISLPEGASEQEQENRYKLERSYVMLFRNSFNPDSLFRPVSLKELAVLHEIDYAVDMFDHIKGSGGYSSLWDLTVENVSKFLQLVGNGEPLCLYIDDFERYWKDWPNKGDEAAKQRNEIDDIQTYFNFQARSAKDACSYLFRKGHPWCLATFEDLQEYILACDNKTAEQLASVDGLEYFEISLEYGY